MCDAVTAGIAFAVIGSGLGIASQVVSYQQQKANVAYRNQVAEQEYEFAQMQVSSAREYESQKSILQDDIISQNATIAALAHANDIAQLNLALSQEQEAAAQKKREAAVAGLQMRGEVLASGKSGAVVDSLIADFYRQQANFDFATSRNLAFTFQQGQQQKVGAQATYASRLASQNPYLKQTILDPIQPIKTPDPSSLPYILNAGSAVASSIAGGMSLTSGLKGLNATKPPPVPGLPTNSLGGSEVSAAVKAGWPGSLLY